MKVACLSFVPLSNSHFFLFIHLLEYLLQKVEEAQKPNVWITKERFQLELVAIAKITMGTAKLSAPKSPSRTSVRQSAGMQAPEEQFKA